jgi:hypothetical protein
MNLLSNEGSNSKMSLDLLFNLNFKLCKYCNKPFYPQHNRQVHCNSQHRKWYKDARFVERRRKQRQQQRVVSFIDSHGNFIKMNCRHLNETGSMFTRNEYHRKENFSQELNDVRKQVKALGLR